VVVTGGGEGVGVGDGAALGVALTVLIAVGVVVTGERVRTLVGGAGFQVKNTVVMAAGGEVVPGSEAAVVEVGGAAVGEVAGVGEVPSCSPAGGVDALSAHPSAGGSVVPVG
jgi:hypothetical protein